MGGVDFGLAKLRALSQTGLAESDELPALRDRRPVSYPGLTAPFPYIGTSHRKVCSSIPAGPTMASR